MSKIVNKTKLAKIVRDLWNTCKNLNNANLKNATLNEADNKITFTKADNTTTVDVSMEKFARLDRKNDFAGDVTVNDAVKKGNSSLGTGFGTINARNRTVGARNLSTAMFTDGYVSALRVHLPVNYSGTDLNVHVWAIKKGATKNDDRTATKVFSGSVFPIVTTQDNKKYVDVKLNRQFTDDTYFIFRTSGGGNIQAITGVASANEELIVNISDSFNVEGANQTLPWDTSQTGTTAHVELIGRIGIKGLVDKIQNVENAGSQYVLRTETTNVGGTGHGGKVVKLDTSGKLHADMLPAIDGVVSTVNSQSGAVTLGMTLEDSGLKFKVNNTDINTIEIISDAEIEEIINGLS